MMHEPLRETLIHALKIATHSSQIRAATPPTTSLTDAGYTAIERMVLHHEERITSMALGRATSMKLKYLEGPIRLNKWQTDVSLSDKDVANGWRIHGVIAAPESNNQAAAADGTKQGTKPSNNFVLAVVAVK